MNASSQTPGPLPGYINLQITPTTSTNPDVPARLVVQRPEPLMPMCADCGNRRSPLAPRGEERYPSGAQVLTCLGTCPPTPRNAATGIITAAINDGRGTPAEIADAEEAAGLLFDPELAKAIADGAYQQAKAETAAELAAARQDREALDWFHSRWLAAGQLCEGRDPQHMLNVGEILTALDGRVPTRVPLTVTWDGIVANPTGDQPGEDTLVAVTTARGGQAVLVLDDDQRQTLAALLDLQVRDIRRPCPTKSCGTDHDLDASDLFGWSRLQVASLGDGPRWYCSDMCVFDALARAGHEPAFDDQAAAVDPGQQHPYGDPLAYGPSGIRCGCGKPAHSNLVPCQPDEPVDAAADLDARYGLGASDEYALQVAEAYEDGLADERGRDGADQAEDGVL